MQVPQRAKDCVVFLYIKDEEEPYPIGTGFFLYYPEVDIFFYYLVTCKHVVEHFLDHGVQIYLRLNRDDRGGVEYVPIKGNWYFHDDPAVDLAVLHWQAPDSKPGNWVALDLRDVLFTSKMSQKVRHKIGEGDDVLFIGLFEQYTGYNKNIPIVRHGRIALVTDEPIEGEYGLSEYLLIECQAYPGNSGSPLFIAVGREGEVKTLFILGVICGMYPHEQKVFSDKGQLTLYTHFGISTTAIANKIYEIIYGDEMTAARKKITDEKKRRNKPKPVSITKTEGQDVLTRDDFFNILGKVSKPLTDDKQEEDKE